MPARPARMARRFPRVHRVRAAAAAAPEPVADRLRVRRDRGRCRLGYPNVGWSKAHTGPVSSLTTVAVFLVIYPMMVNVRVEALARAGRNVRGLLLAVAFNFVWAPLLGYVLAHLFRHDPMLALGFLLVMVVPCSSMSIAYTGMAGGDVELATVIVGSSFVLAVPAVPLWMGLFAAQYHVPIPMHDMLTSILTVLIAPMLAGWLTRRVEQRTRGEASLKRLQPAFSAASMLACSRSSS